MTSVDLEKIKELCRTNGISLAALEKTLGFSNKALFRWATSAPSIDKVKAVAEYFDVSVDYLLGNSTEEIKSQEQKKHELLQAAFTRPEMRMLFSVAEDCTAEEIEQAIKIIEALKK